MCGTHPAMMAVPPRGVIGPKIFHLTTSIGSVRQAAVHGQRPVKLHSLWLQDEPIDGSSKDGRPGCDGGPGEAMHSKAGMGGDDQDCDSVNELNKGQ